jgi:hypothetical protein
MVGMIDWRKTTERSTHHTALRNAFEFTLLANYRGFPPSSRTASAAFVKNRVNYLEKPGLALLKGDLKAGTLLL